jgi:hypothetical protein
MIEVLLTLYALITLIMLVARFEWGVVLLMPLLPLAMYTYRSPITGLNTNNLLIYTAFAMGFLRRLENRGMPLPPATGAMLILMGFTLLAWVIGYINYRSVGYQTWEVLINLERWILYALLYFAIYFGWSDKVPMRRVLVFMFIGVLAAALANVAEIFHPSAYMQKTGRAGGLFQQANSNGIFMASYAFLPVVLAATTRSPFARLLYRVTFVLCVGGVLLSISRAAFLCLIMSALVYAFFTSRRLFAVIVLAMCLMVPAYSVVLPEKAVKRIEETFTGGSRYKGAMGKLEESAANRVVQDLAGLKLFMDSPIFGHGLSGFYYRSPRYLPPAAPPVTRMVHSSFFWALVEGGILTTGAFLWLLFKLWEMGKRLYDAAGDEPDRLMGLYLMTIMVSKVIANFFNLDFFTGDVSSYVWVTAGLVAWRSLRLPEAVRAPALQPSRQGWRPRPGPGVRPPVMHG